MPNPLRPHLGFRLGRLRALLAAAILLLALVVLLFCSLTEPAFASLQPGVVSSQSSAETFYGADDRPWFYYSRFNTTYTAYEQDGANPISVTDITLVAEKWLWQGASSSQQVVKMYNLGSRTVAIRRGSELVYTFQDHLGSPALETDVDGNVVASHKYEPYGTIRGTEWTLAIDRGFTGQTIERGLGLHDYGARHYAQPLGRWIAPDTIVPEPGNPQSLNRYAYVNNNPLRYRDSSGNTPWDVVDVGFWLWSAKDFIEDPSWGNAGWWALDTLSLLPLLPSVGWVRRGGQVIFSADEARDIARLGSHARDFVRIAHIPGAERLLANLLSTSGTTRRGAEFELEFALRHANEVEEISRVLEVVQGGEKEIDFVLKGDVFVNVKNLDWAEYKPFVLERHTERMVEEAMSFLKYDPNAVKYVFKSSVPDSVREALEAAGIIVEVVP